MHYREMINSSTKASQRHAIFRTRCTVNGKVCYLLIDGCCTENIISKHLIQALNLMVTKHLYPYKISWIKKSVDILVFEMCRLTFSIGRHFVCEVLRNVLEMDACHLNLDDRGSRIWVLYTIVNRMLILLNGKIGSLSLWRLLIHLLLIHVLTTTK